jgi:hypothetical protein
MASVRVTQKKVVALILDEAEAEWLKSIVQNPLCDNESSRDSEMRKEIFNNLDKAGILKCPVRSTGLSEDN